MNSVVSSVMLEDEQLPVLLQDGTDGSANAFYSERSSFLWGENMTKDKSDKCDRRLTNPKPFKFPESSSGSCLDNTNEHFSYYTTDADKLIKHLEFHNAGTESFASPTYPTWSPICSHISIHPTVEVGAERLNETSTADGDSTVKRHSSNVPEKLSYSDVLIKSPVLQQQQQQQAKSDAKPLKSERNSKPTVSTSREPSVTDESNVTSVPNHKTFWQAKHGKTTDRSSTHVDAGNDNKTSSDDATTCNNPTSRITGCDAASRADARDGSGTESSERELPKVTLNNNVQNPQKASAQKRPLNFNNNLSSSWQDVKYPLQFKPKVKNTKQAADADETPPTQRRGNPESEPVKKQMHRKTTVNHSKELPRKSASRRRQKSSENIDIVWAVVAVHLQQCICMLTMFIHWLLDLILDVSQMSAKLGWQILQNVWMVSVRNFNVVWDKTKYLVFRIVTYFLVKFNKSQPTPTKKSTKVACEPNISLPTTREAAMKRLLSCKGKDPYSILGVGPLASDEDIKKYYRRQAFLVHPDKNPTPGTEEAFKILAQAFELIGEPERRQSYNSKMMEAHQLETAWDEFSELITKLREKVEEAANTIKCTKCGDRHQRVKVERPCYSARYCAACKTFHAARDGDIWAESTCLGFLWHYYACMENTIYDVTQWAGCQMKNLQHLKANHHNVQYRIVSTKRSPSSENIPRGPDLEDLLSAFQGKKMPPNATASNNNTNTTTPSSSASKADNGKKKRNKKKR